MNPFDRIREYRKALLQQIKNTLVKPSDTLTYEQHYTTMMNFLKLLETDLKNTRYEYVVESIGKGPNRAAFNEFNGMTLQAETIGENLILFQPLFADGHDIGGADIDSLADALQALKEAGRIEEDILIIPPGVNVLRARLADPDDPNIVDDDGPLIEDDRADHAVNAFETIEPASDVDVMYSYSQAKMMNDDSDYDDLPF